MNLFDLIFIFVVLYSIFLCLSHLRMLAQEREIREAYERQKKIFERTFTELGIETPMPALGNPNAKKRFGIGWVVFCILAGIWLALILRPWIIILLSIGPKEFIRLFF